jgi:hypothetical protein
VLIKGTKGATLRDLQEQSGARIQSRFTTKYFILLVIALYQVDRDHQVTNPNERQVAIYGNAEQISQAKTLLDQLINGGGSSVRVG